MKWNQEIFYNNIRALIIECCAGNASIFNKKIKSRDAATRWKTKKPSMKSVHTIVDVFGVSLNWLLTSKGEMFLMENPNGAITPISDEAEMWKNKYLEVVEKLLKAIEELNKLKEARVWSGEERRVAKLPSRPGAK